MLALSNCVKALAWSLVAPGVVRRALVEALLADLITFVIPAGDAAKSMQSPFPSPQCAASPKSILIGTGKGEGPVVGLGLKLVDLPVHVL